MRIFTTKRIDPLLRVYALLVFLCAALSLTACGWRGGNEPRPTKPGTQEPQNEVYSPENKADQKRKPEPATRQVYINGERLSDEAVDDLERQYRARMRDGRYWYDSVCGAWGFEGGPCAGITSAGLDLGGRLRADASNGDTRVFINGRELNDLDILGLRQIVNGYVAPGRYWLDANGYWGYEGGPVAGNLIEAARHNGGGSSGSGRSSALTTWDRTGIAVYDLSQ